MVLNVSLICSQNFERLMACALPQLGFPYIHEQSGVAERRNRTLLNMVRSMLALANLPTSF